MQTLDLADQLRIRPTADGRIALRCNRSDLPTDGGNLIVQAAELLKARLGLPELGASIELDKRIPIGAGLAGGSSNGAAALLGLNALWGCGFGPAELQTMATALGELVGEHDFSAFQKAGSRRSHARTTVQEVSLVRQGDLITTEIQASGFLYGMVRLLMGQLVSVGEGRLGLDAFRERWHHQRRQDVKEAAPPQGLCLLRVGYPQPVFPEAAWYDCQPRYQLEISDSPDLQPGSAQPFVSSAQLPPGGAPARR